MSIERLHSIYDYLKAGKKVTDKGDFATKLGYKSRTYVSEVLNGRKPMTDDFEDKLSSIFNVNTTWLKTGGGEMFKGGQPHTPIVTKGTGDQKTGTLARVMKFLREFDAPLAKWVANKVDGPGLDEEDVLLLEDKLAQIRKNIDTEMQEEIKILPLNKKKKDNSQ